MSEPYHYVRFRWGPEVDIEKAMEELSTAFSVERITMPSSDDHVQASTIQGDRDRDELRVKADTLTALLSRIRAMLFQKESAPFTKKDVKLRERILELYPHSRSTPLPFFFQSEPKFSVEK